MEQRVESGPVLLVSEDERRTIKELNLADAAVTDFVIKGSVKPVGQHFHRYKSETFLFSKGGGTIRTVPMDNDGKSIGLVTAFDFKVENGGKYVVHIPAMVAHRFDLLPGTEMSCFSSKPFNEQDKDLNPYVIAD